MGENATPMPAPLKDCVGPAALALFVIVAGTLAASAAEAQMAPVDSWYFRAEAGASISDGAGGNILTGSGFGQDFGSSALIGLGAGYAFAPVTGAPIRFRLDLTGADRVSYDSTHSGTAGGLTLTGKTSLNTATLLGTAYADYLTGTAFTPYLGLGMGFALNSLDRVSYSFNGTPSASEGGKTQTNLAWSIGAGLAYQLTDAIAIDGGYRYLYAGRVSTDGNVRLLSPAATVRQAPVKSDLHAHELVLGLRYSF